MRIVFILSKPGKVDSSEKFLLWTKQQIGVATAAVFPWSQRFVQEMHGAAGKTVSLSFWLQSIDGFLIILSTIVFSLNAWTGNH